MTMYFKGAHNLADIFFPHASENEKSREMKTINEQQQFGLQQPLFFPLQTK